MKKRMHKLCTILTASALLAMSVTVYAAEGDNTEAGFQPAEEGTVQSADTEQTQETASEQTEEKDPEENGLDSFIYIREKEDKTTEKAKVKKVTIEELKEEIDANQVPELAAVVFQFSDEEFETEALTENTTEFETETQSETTESESETATETETESEPDKDSEIEKYPTVELSDMQKDMVYEVAELVPQTVVIFNQCELENNLVFTDCKEVKAVTVLKADTEKELKKAIQKYNLEKEYADYLELQSEKKSASKGQARTTSTSKALQCHRRPLRQIVRLPLHRQTVWQEAVQHREAVLLQEALLMDHPAAPHQEAVRHPEQQPDRRTLHSNLSRMRYTAEKRAFQQLTAYPAQKRLHMEK